MPSKRLVAAVYGLLALVALAAILSHVAISMIDARATIAGHSVLATRVPEFRAMRLPFDQAVARLSQASGVPIEIDSGPFEASRIFPDTLVSQVLFDVTLEQALDILKNAAPTPYLSGTIAYRPNDRGGVTIVPPANVSRVDDQLLAAYDVRDLVETEPAPFFNALPDLIPASNSPYGSGLFGPTRKDLIDELITVIVGNVDSDSWLETGGTIGRIQECGGVLFIQQSSRGHEKIARLLQQLRHPEGAP